VGKMKLPGPEGIVCACSGTVFLVSRGGMDGFWEWPVADRLSSIRISLVVVRCHDAVGDTRLVCNGANAPTMKPCARGGEIPCASMSFQFGSLGQRIRYLPRIGRLGGVWILQLCFFWNRGIHLVCVFGG